MKTVQKTATIHFRIEPKIKERAIKVFSKQNIDISFALQTFLNEVVRKDKTFIEIKTENGLLPSVEKKMLKRYKAAKLEGPFSNTKQMIDRLSR